MLLVGNGGVAAVGRGGAAGRGRAQAAGRGGAGLQGGAAGGGAAQRGRGRVNALLCDPSLQTRKRSKRKVTPQTRSQGKRGRWTPPAGLCAGPGPRCRWSSAATCRPGNPHQLRRAPPSPTAAAVPTAGHLQMKPRAVLEATAQVPPFLHGFPLQPLMTDSQRRPGDESGREKRALPRPGTLGAGPDHHTHQYGRRDTRSGSR